MEKIHSLKENKEFTTWELVFVALSGLGLVFMLFLGVLILKAPISSLPLI